MSEGEKIAELVRKVAPEISGKLEGEVNIGRCKTKSNSKEFLQKHSPYRHP